MLLMSPIHEYSHFSINNVRLIPLDGDGSDLKFLKWQPVPMFYDRLPAHNVPIPGEVSDKVKAA
jgi:hypothetical protein